VILTRDLLSITSFGPNAVRVNTETGYSDCREAGVVMTSTGHVRLPVIGKVGSSTQVTGNPTSMISLCQEGKSSPDALRRSAGTNSF
jgi:hypothetical protein